MPAIASLEDLKAAQKDLLAAKDLGELKAVFKKWRNIGWKNICKLWFVKNKRAVAQMILATIIHSSYKHGNKNQVWRNCHDG